MALLEEELSEKVIGAFYDAYNQLGYGFLEKVYENAMIVNLKKMKINGRQQVPIDVYFKENNIGSYFADLIVENKIIVELKAAKCLCKEHEAQLLNYLRATKIEVGFLFNFGIKPDFRRKIFHNKFKKSVPIC